MSDREASVYYSLKMEKKENKNKMGTTQHTITNEKKIIKNVTLALLLLHSIINKYIHK